MPSSLGLNDDDVSPLSPDTAGARLEASFCGSLSFFLPEIDLVTVETIPVIVSVKPESSPKASSSPPPLPASELLLLAVSDRVSLVFFSGAASGFAAAGLAGAAFFGSGRGLGFGGVRGAAPALPEDLKAESGASR